MFRTVARFTLFATTVAMLAPVALFAQPKAPERLLRVMTYNIKHGQTNEVCTQPPRVPGQPPFPDCGLDLQASAAVIAAHDPDIVGMQEIDRFWARSAGLDEPAELASWLGFEHYCYAANLTHSPDSHALVAHEYGTLVLSRFPILECENTFLRRVGNTEQRGLLKVLVNVRGVPLQFYNTHLHTVQADRLLQTEDIAAVLDAAPAGPRVVVGDFNARSTFTTTVTEMLPIYERLLDAWREAPLPTADNPNGFTSPARLVGNPTSRIDYVFVSPDVQVNGTYVPVDDQTRFAADHYPVVADIALPGSAVGIGRQRAPTVPDVDTNATADAAESDEADAPPLP
jgi:endonuclease/exonuclease/phosphatase family metal-dependent hydrolase